MLHRSSHTIVAAAAALLLALLVPSTAGQASTRSLDVKLCVPVPTQKHAALPEAFRPFEGYIRQCRLDRGGRAERIFVVAIWIAALSDEGPPDLARQTVPLPVLIDGQERHVGDLPAPFPSDAPLFTRLQITSDRSGWPIRIDQTARTDAIGTPPRFTPLVWNPRLGRFIKK